MRYPRQLALFLALATLTLLFPASAGTTRRASQPLGTAQEDGRPILYFDIESNQLVIRAVSAGGRALGIMAEGALLGWAPRSDWFAYYSHDESLTIKNLDGDERVLFKPPTGERIITWGAQGVWSPDGDRVAVIAAPEAREPYLAVIDVASANLSARHALGPHFQPLTSRYFTGDSLLYGLRWSPDGTRVLISWGGTFVLDVRTGSLLTITDQRSIGEWDPTGSAVLYFVAVSRGEAELRRAEFSPDRASIVKDGQIAAAFRGPYLLPLPLMSLSPDGSRLAVLGGEPTQRTNTVFLIQPNDDSPVFELGYPAPISALSWSPDGQRLAGLAIHEDGLKIEILDPESREWSALTPLIFVPKGTEIDIVALVRSLAWAS